MIEKTLARRYSAALLDVAEIHAKVDIVGEQLDAIGRAISTSIDIKHFLAHPRIPRERKREVVLKSMGSAIDPLVESFLSLVVEKGRVQFLSDFAEMYTLLAIERSGVANVTVSSFYPLSSLQKDALKVQLEALLTKQVTIESEVDTALKGGLRVQVGDSVIDGSVAGRLKKLRETLVGHLL